MPRPAQPVGPGKRVEYSGVDPAAGTSKRTENTWKLPPRYEVKDLLGKGAYGHVCEAYDSAENRPVAIKRIVNLFGETLDSKRILREIAIMSRLNHENVVRLYDIPPPSDLQGFGEIYIVMEKVDTDFKKLCRDPKMVLTDAHVKTLLYNLLLGLGYLHSAGVYHRDLTPGNCLVNQDLTVKICDFGLSRAIVSDRHCQELDQPVGWKAPHPEGHDRRLTAHVVTRWYRAPELILLQDDYTEAIDIWSAGCIFAELLNLLDSMGTAPREPLFPGDKCFPMSPGPKPESRGKCRDGDQLSVIFEVLGTPSEADMEWINADASWYLRRFKKREGTGLNPRFAGVPSPAIDMLQRMLRFNPLNRIKATEAFEHKLFEEIRVRSKETTAPSLVDLEFEAEKSLDEAQLRHYFCKEMQKFIPEL